MSSQADTDTPYRSHKGMKVCEFNVQLKPPGAVCGYTQAKKTMPLLSLQSAIKDDVCHNFPLSLQTGVFATCHMAMIAILVNVKKKKQRFPQLAIKEKFPPKIILAQASQL